jgi:SAM-dependent methyltransferase
MTDTLESVQQFWDRHARRDPLWAILSYTAKRDGKWDTTRFFETGANEIAAMLGELDAQGIVPNRGSALDFGCGVGRLTQGLGPHFGRVVGVDISPKMCELATELNRFPTTISYICNDASHLRVLQNNTFDFIVSSIVLQHLQPELALGYLTEFFRVLAPGGIMVVQLPSHRRRADQRAPISVPMPDDAYRASLVAHHVPDRAVAPSQEIMLDVDVTNHSAIDWLRRDFGVIRVGNHWLDAAGSRMLARDDGRTSLPSSLGSRQTCRVPLTIKAPAEAGQYLCEIDLAHEGVLWFHDRESPVVRFMVRVGPAQDSDTAAEPVDTGTYASMSPDHAPEPQPINGPDPQADDSAAFPMFGVRLTSVVQLIANCGGTLLHVENDRTCGEDWISYRYIAQKDGARPAIAEPA